MTKIYSIKPKDIAFLFSKSYKQAYRDYCRMRISLNKKKKQIITIDETAQYFGIKPEVIRESLGAIY